MIFACTIDRRFAQSAGAMLASLFDKGEIDGWRTIVFGYGLRARDEARLRESCGSDGKRLEFIRVDPRSPDLRRRLSVRNNFSRATYARLLIPGLLTAKSERLLYLDADTLVLASLRPLVDLDLGGHVLAAVEDHLHPSADGKLPFPRDKPYFNSGFLLIDLARWRSEDISRRAFEFAERYAHCVRFPDQDALNCIIAGNFQRLGREWNFHYDRVKDGTDFPMPRVMHFAGSIKPWSRECTHPARDLFLHYRATTPWRSQRLITRFERRMSKILRKRLRRLEQRWFERAASMRARGAREGEADA